MPRNAVRAAFLAAELGRESFAAVIMALGRGKGLVMDRALTRGCPAGEPELKPACKKKEAGVSRLPWIA